MGNPLATAACSVRLVTNGVPQKGSFPFRGGIVTAWRFGVWTDGGVGTEFLKSLMPIAGSNRVFFDLEQNAAEVPTINYQLEAGTGFASDTAINAVVEDRAISGCRLVSGGSKIFIPPNLGLTSAEIVNAALHVTGLYLTSGTRAVSLGADVARTCTVVSGSATLSHTSATAIAVGSRVEGDGIPPGSYIISSTSTTAVMNVGASGDYGSAALVFGGHIETAESVSCTRTSGNTVVAHSARRPISVGSIVTGTAITAGAYVVSSTTTSVTLSIAPTANGTSSLVFTPTASADAEVTLTIAGHLIVAANASAYGESADYTLSSSADTALWPNPATSIREGDLVAIALPWGYTLDNINVQKLYYRTVYGYIGGISQQLGFSFLLFRDAALTIIDDEWWDDDNWFEYLRTSEPIYATVHRAAEVVADPFSGIARLRVSTPSLAVLGGAFSMISSATLQTRASMRSVSANEEVSMHGFARLRLSVPALRNLSIDVPMDTRAKLNLSLPRLRGAPVRARIHQESLRAATQVTVSLMPDVAMRTSATLTVSTPRLRGHTSMRCYVQFASRTSLKMVIETDAMNVRQLCADVMSLWSKGRGAESADRPEFRDRFISDLNGSIQEIWSAAERLNYFNRKTVEATVGAGETSVQLDGEVQKLLGEVRISGTKKPLFCARSRTELEQYASLYPGATSPQAYFVEQLGETDVQATKIMLHITPAKASGTCVLSVEASTRPPRYSWRDVEQATQIRLPHAWGESLLVPLLRHRAATFRYFFNEPMRQSIADQYGMARAILGLAEPAPLQAKPDKEAAAA